jgi:hypothetical protein
MQIIVFWKHESVTIKMTHFVFRVTQKHFIKCVLHVRVSRLLHIMKNKMCHFDCNGLAFLYKHNPINSEKFNPNVENFDITFHITLI